MDMNNNFLTSIYLKIREDPERNKNHDWLQNDPRDISKYGTLYFD